MKVQTFETVRRVVFGVGAVETLPDEIKRAKGTRVLVVTDPGIKSAGVLDLVANVLARAKVDFSVFAEVEPDPKIEVALAAAEAAKAAGPDLIVGLGGGSSLDISKVTSILTTNPGPVDKYFGMEMVPQAGVPLILIPTTAGTGSEMTSICVLSDTKNNVKKGIVSEHMFARAALLDPQLTLALPPRVTAMTGIDAMVHAIEAYTSKLKKNPISDNLARSALTLLGAHIRTAVHDGRQREARAAMLLGAMQAGQAFANAPVAAVHALAYPLGGHYHIPHGLSNSLVLPSVLRFNLEAAAGLYAELAPILVPGVTGSDEARATALIEALEQLIGDLSLPATLRAAEVRADSLETLAADAMLQQRLLVNNPREVTCDDALAIYRAAYGA
jgi:alcohol dehydrogenase